MSIVHNVETSRRPPARQAAPATPEGRPAQQPAQPAVAGDDSDDAWGTWVAPPSGDSDDAWGTWVAPPTEDAGDEDGADARGPWQ